MMEKDRQNSCYLIAVSHELEQAAFVCISKSLSLIRPLCSQDEENRIDGGYLKALLVSTSMNTIGGIYLRG